jgi:hypothetical protein
VALWASFSAVLRPASDRAFAWAALVIALLEAAAVLALIASGRIG